MAYLSVPYAILPSIQQTDVDLDDDGNTSSIHRSILSVFKNKRYEWNNMFKNLAGAWCIGSSHGWLVLLDTKATPLLLNPSSSTCIHLPPFPPAFLHPVTQSYFIQYLRKIFIVKAALMHSSSPRNCILAIIYGCHCKLALCKSSTWVKLSDAKRYYYDIVFKNNYLYALAEDGSIEGWDVSQLVPRKILEVRPTMEIDEKEDREFPKELFSMQLYLVMSGEEILLVKRYIGNFVNEDGVAVDEGCLLSSEDTHPLLCPYRTKHFSVYKLDYIKINWEKMKSLKGRILFLGANESVSIPVQALHGCEANSIYFSDDRWDEMNLDYSYGGHDWGVFNLQDGSVKLPIPYEDKINPPPVWVIPSPESIDDSSISS